MTGELYARLGVQRDATPQQIHRAYRKAAKTAHPDAGGSPDQWAAIVQAYETLKDERRRRVYDDTGEIEPGAADNHYAARLMRIAAAMGEIAAQSPRLTEIDLPNRLRMLFRQRIAQLRQGLVDMGSRARDWDEVARRLTVPPGQINVLRGLAEGEAGGCRRRASEAEQAIREHEDALKLIENAGWTPGERLTMPQLMARGGQIGQVFFGEKMW
jgi:hypothetical protein